MLNFEFTEEQKALREEVRAFCAKEIAPRVRKMDTDQEIPGEAIQGLAGLGLTGMVFSKDCGGRSADPITVGVVTEEIARADISCSIPTYFLLQNVWGGILDLYGGEEARAAILPHVAAGRAFLGIAATEPVAGSDLNNIQTTAVKKGDRYVLDGSKLHISGVREILNQFPEGGGYLVLAKTDPGRGTRGMSLFYLPFSDTPGITHSLLEEWGRRGMSAGAFAMKDVEVPAAYLLGEEHKGFYMLMEGFDYARALIALVCCGAAMSSLERAMVQIKDRKAFGQPIARFEGVQFKLAEHWTRLEAVRLLAYRALWMHHRNRKGEGFDRFHVTKACAESKLLAPQTAFEAINDAIQWFGAFGYTVNCPLELALKGVRSYYWAEGAVEVMRIIVGRELLGKEYVALR